MTQHLRCSEVEAVDMMSAAFLHLFGWSGVNGDVDDTDCWRECGSAICSRGNYPKSPKCALRFHVLIHETMATMAVVFCAFCKVTVVM
jgi:hypothetical protein